MSWQGLNAIANDLGIDTIETGGMVGVLMEAGVGKFGDTGFITEVLEEVRNGTERGRLWAQGTAAVGEHYRVRRVPVIKRQAISAYDPRVVEATGITMMVTAQGADHTAGERAPHGDRGQIHRQDCGSQSCRPGTGRGGGFTGLVYFRAAPLPRLNWTG